ncbi:Pre-mRNA-splicing factor cwc26 [Coniochaeta pulveracea]|uniref:Pre-mRNA-splicing factor cwc26 n=1 Tax=Coniochaeta pulveracea TaxID=177199 RepID=A0A420YD60_9PEZI|nr:Pre-mRNA-splicing factor cwc26 [Coniochaeta pulveracea]
MPDLNSYLAQHYLVAESKPSKKRKRKTTKSTDTGLIIADEDDSGWGKTTTNSDDEGDLPTTVAGTSAEFRRAKKSGWKTIVASKDDSGDTADAVLASAAKETEAAGRDAEEGPTVVAENEGDRRMADGTIAGLQSAAVLTAQIAKRRAQEIAELEEMERERRKKKKKGGGEEDEVIYRDATGRRVDASMRRAEARRAAASAEEKEAERLRQLKGDVQLEEARRKREQLEDAKLMTVARSKDDEELNADLKAQTRWNDPMAQFLAEDDRGARASGGKKGGGGAKSRRPVYKGAAPPNRYGIWPGYRWDGVDRSNGFEAERFKALNRRERNKGLEYSWQMDE